MRQRSAENALIEIAEELEGCDSIQELIREKAAPRLYQLQPTVILGLIAVISSIVLVYLNPDTIRNALGPKIVIDSWSDFLASQSSAKGLDVVEFRGRAPRSARTQFLYLAFDDPKTGTRSVMTKVDVDNKGHWIARASLPTNMVGTFQAYVVATESPLTLGHGSSPLVKQSRVSEPVII